MWICPKCNREFKNVNQSHYCGEKPTTIDAYILAQEEIHQQELFQMRDILCQALPEAEERMTWSMPTYWKGSNIVHFAASKNHIGFYPGQEAVDFFSEELKKYKTSKGTVQIPYGQIDADLVAKIAKWCIKTRELPKVLLLDLDDTITSFDINGKAAWIKTCDEFAKRYKMPFSGEILLAEINKTRKWFWADPERNKAGRNDILNSRRTIVKTTLTSLFGCDYMKLEEHQKQSDEMADYYSKMQNETIEPLPNVVEALQLFINMGIRLAVVTNGVSSTQREKLDRFDLTHFFEEIFIDTEIGYSKPDTEIFRFALKKMNVNADEAWMVGDNLEWDVRGPQKAGIFSVWCNSKKLPIPEDSKDYYVVDSLFALAGKLQGINKNEL